jgi:hypothetical protein
MNDSNITRSPKNPKIHGGFGSNYHNHNNNNRSLIIRNSNQQRRNEINTNKETK